MCCGNNGLNEKLAEGLLVCKEDKKRLKDALDTWTEALEELSEIEDAFKIDGKFELLGKTV
jgi:hypothetical protein